MESREDAKQKKQRAKQPEGDGRKQKDGGGGKDGRSRGWDDAVDQKSA